MIIEQDIYDYKYQNKIIIKYDDVTMTVTSSSTSQSLSNHPYFIIENTKQLSDSFLWISSDNKIIPLGTVFPLFSSAKEMINVLREKRTSDMIDDYINYLKL